MAAVMTLPYMRETVVAQTQPEISPANIEFFPDAEPPEVIQGLVAHYNSLVAHGGKRAVFELQPAVEHASNGLSFARFGDTAETLIVVQNPFATGLHAPELCWGQFLYDSLVATNTVGSDGATPQVVQVASPCRSADIPLTPKEHWRVSNGQLDPITDKIAELTFTEFPEIKATIALGFSLSGFLTPDILLSLSRGKDILAGLIANPPGVKPEPMPAILGKFAHAGDHMSEHLFHGGLRVLEPKTIVGLAGKVCEKAGVVADVVWRPTNLSLWRAFSRGQLLERFKTLHQRIPEAIISIAFGLEDPLCSPKTLEAFLYGFPEYNGVVVEHGDHAWGQNLPRSMGHLATEQIRKALTAKPKPPHLQIPHAA